MSMLSLLFPAKCVLCGARLPLSGRAMLCQTCGQGDWRHGRGERFSLSGADEGVAALQYAGAVRTAMQAYKFQARKGSGKWFAAQAAPFLAARLEDWRPDLLTYVPLSLTGYWKRGYNQSALAARLLARRFALPCVPLLRRRTFAKKQSRLSGAARQENAGRSFAEKRGVRLQGKRIVLVDDVVTTGATLAACAQILRARGAERVFLLALTKTPRNGPVNW